MGLAAIASVAVAATPPAGVVSFSPQGDARGATQVAVSFSAPMVRFGDPRQAAPVSSTCPAGDGRWLDDRTWVHEFERPLPAGVSCRFTLLPGLRALGGQAVRSDMSLAVVSGAPSVVAISPSDGSEIDSAQAFLLRLDGQLDPASLEAVSCVVDGVAESLPVRLLPAAQREQLLANLAREDWTYEQFIGASEDAGIGDEAVSATGRRPDLERQVVALECARELPARGGVRLAWGPGLRSSGGVSGGTAQHFDFTVRPDFTARLVCTRLQSRSPCLPIKPVEVAFSAPVPAAAALAVRLRTPEGKRLAPREQARDSRPVFDAVSFAGPFLPRGEYVLELPPGMVDDAGRPLANQARFPQPVAMDALPPLAKFAATFGVLELNAGPALPVTLRDVEDRAAAAGAPPAVPGRVLTLRDDLQAMRWLRLLESSNYQPETSLLASEKGARAIAVPRAEAAGTTEVVGIPLDSPGLHVVELASPRLGARLLEPATSYHVRSAALVTNLAVHFKQGRENSLAWVTRLDTGAPVAGASVTVRDCRGQVMVAVRSDASGIARLPGDKLPEERSRCDQWWHGWFVSARLGEDFAFALADWNEGLSPWDFGLAYHPDGDGGPIAHVVFDRTLLRAGETVHMKLFLRQPGAAGLTLPPRTRWPDRLVIAHLGGQEWELPIRIDAGVAAVDWTVPREARLGTYRVRARLGSEDYGIEAGEFRVEDFRLPTLRASLQLPRAPLVAATRAPVDISLTYLSGGGAAGAPVSLRSRTEPYTAEFAGYDDFRFDPREITVGLRRYGETQGEPAAESGALLPLKLDAQGGARSELQLPANGKAPRRLVVEMEYPDANGERLTTSQSATLWPSSLVVGLRSERSPRSGKAFGVDTVVLDLDGKPAADREVRIDAYARVFFSYRRRLVGGFYAYDGGIEVRRMGEVCRGTSDARGRFHCAVTVKGEEGLYLSASTRDAAGRETRSVEEVWLAGEDAWYGGTDSDRMDLVPEKRRYEVGETAKLRAELPFRAATALVTVEREGVLDAWVRPLTAAEPTVSVPIRVAHAPNMFVSVLAVRGRVAKPAPTALVDLGRPAFRIGLVELEVGRRPHELVVEVQPSRAVFSPRDKARVEVKVRRADGGPLPAGTEFAFAAVDEALLELHPNESWNLLEAMLAPRSLAVNTSTSIGQVIGRRHYGRKAIPAGGGGGRMPTRELFEPLLKWQARVPVDAAGRATLEVPLNDSLSAFKLVAIAHGGQGLFGTGSASVRTHRDLMLIAGFPQLVREGDRVTGTAILRNAGTTPMSVAVSAQVKPDAGSAVPLPAQQVSLAPGESREISWPYEVPRGTRSLAITVGAGEGTARDELTVRQRVLPWPGEPTTWQATLRRVDKPVSLPVAPPSGAMPGVGGVEVTLSSSLVAGLAGVRAAMEAYPYACIEQRASKAVALGDRGAWDKVMASLPTHLADDGLVAYFPGLPRGNPELTAYLVSVAQEAGWTLPEASRDQMLEALERLASGAQAPRLRVGGASLLLRLKAMDALSRHGRVKPEWLESLGSTPETWPTAALLDWYAVLDRTPAARQRDDRLAAARQLLRSRMVLTGTRLGFAGEEGASMPWLLTTADNDAVRALSLLSGDAAFAADAPALALGALGRQTRGSWDSTVANAWGVLALQRYARLYERTPVGGVTSLASRGPVQRLDWSRTPAGGLLSLPWSQASGQLKLTHEGSGAPYAVVRSVAAVPLTKPVFAGYRLRKTLTPVVRAQPGRWSRGDVLRVRIEVEVLADATWVALDDPLPAGAVVIDGGLKRGLAPMPTPPARGVATAWPSFVERRAEAYRAYFEELPRGRWQVEYSIRLNAGGRFVLPATRVESMYEADRFAAVPNPTLEVGPTP